MDTREALRPYSKQRLAFEGVLVDVIKPKRRNGYTYGLVFASVYAPHENIELDHAVIQMEMPKFHKSNMSLGKRYHFTAYIGMYLKPARILGAYVHQENFMLQHLNLYKLREKPESQMVQPTMYVLNSINNLMMCRQNTRYTEGGLVARVLDMPNDGSVETFIDDLTGKHQQSKVNVHDINDTLYA